MAELYEVLLIDGETRWHAGWVVDDESETDLLLTDRGKVPLFGSRAALEHHAQEHGLKLHDDLPDEVDLDLGGWIPRGAPEPSAAEVSELWHLLYDDPVAGKSLAGEDLGEAYDDLVEEVDDWFALHGEQARKALGSAVNALRNAFRTV